MKRTLVTTFTAAAILSAAHSYAETGVTTGNVFVRSAPSVDSPAVGSLRKGSSIDYTVAPSNQNWLKINFKGKPAYVGRKIVTQVATSKKAAKKEAGQMGNGIESPAPVVAKTPVFEIVPDVSTEELRLRAENEKQAGRIKELEAEILPLKEEVAGLKTDLQAKNDQVQKYHAMFPYLKVIETVENSGKDVMLTGIGRAKMVENDKRIIVRIEGDAITASEKVMKGVAKERYQTGSADNVRVYYVLNSQSVKHIN